MILTRTPLRISLVGGGTDLAAFYRRHYGAVVSFAINKYVNVLVNEKFDGTTRVSYSETENVPHPAAVRHDIVRESLLKFNVHGLEVALVSDIPGEGTGLGSSSALAVGLNVALRSWSGKPVNIEPGFIAEDAYAVERTRCGHPVGKQDHYAAAYGGLHGYRFESDESVIAHLIPLDEEKKSFLENDLMLFWTGVARSSSGILGQLQKNLRESNAEKMGLQLRDMAMELQHELWKGNFQNIARYVDAGWQLKRKMAPGVTDSYIDGLYEAGMRAGAHGGKLLGAGGGGFMLFAGCWGRQMEIEQAVGLRRIPFKIDTRGSRVVWKE